MGQRPLTGIEDVDQQPQCVDVSRPLATLACNRIVRLDRKLKIDMVDRSYLLDNRNRLSNDQIGDRGVAPAVFLRQRVARSCCGRPVHT